MARPADYDELVYDVVEAIPAGRVLTYGDIAELLATFGPRRVAQAMSRSGGAVPWHRVVRAGGSFAPVVAARQLTLLRAEGTPLRGDRVDLARARWVPGPPWAGAGPAAGEGRPPPDGAGPLAGGAGPL